MDFKSSGTLDIDCRNFVDKRDPLNIGKPLG